MPPKLVASWNDDDDWGYNPARTTTTSILRRSPSPPAAISTPTILSSANSQPRALYRPEMKIMKRAPASVVLEPARKPVDLRAESEKKKQLEEQRAERERLYQETKDRIFNTPTTTPPSQSQSPSGKGQGRGNERNGRGRGRGSWRNDSTERGRANSAQRTTAQSQTHSPKPPPAPKTKPSPSPAPLNPNGAIVGISLNNGTFSSAPVERKRDEWQYRQVALDGKMLESEAAIYGLNEDEQNGDPEGLDWDDHRRDVWPGMNEEELEEEDEEFTRRLEKLKIAALEEQRAREGRKNGEVVVAERQPRGPDAGGGRGFRGRAGR